MEPYRERIEDLMWHYWYERSRVFRILAVALAILLAYLLTIRVLRRLRVVAVPVLIGAILIVGWLLLPSLKTSGLIAPIPRFSTESGPVVSNGVAAVLVCGKKQGFERGMEAAMHYVPEPRTGSWSDKRHGDCTVWYHHPPGLEQRIARHERAH